MAEDNIVLDIIQAAGSLATALAVFFVWRQSNQTQKELDATLRPWIGNFNTSYDANTGTLKFHFKNYGRTPGKLVSFRFKHSTDKFSRQNIISEKPIDEYSNATIFPEQERPFDFSVVGDITSMFLGLMIEYEYPNPKYKSPRHEYGIIRKYDNDTDRFLVEDEWAN
jgi:hypothetical protein